LFSLATSLVNLKRIPALEIKSPEGIKPLSFRENSVLKKVVSYYLEKVRERDIFKIGGKRTAASIESKEVKTPTSRIIEATENLKLVGISWSSDPDAMIEDAKAVRTFFVKVGQMIGEVKVQAIFKDRVILRYSGEEIDLR
jgi:type II secretory pathway component PulC